MVSNPLGERRKITSEYISWESQWVIMHVSSLAEDENPLYKKTKAVSTSWNGRTLWKGCAEALTKSPWVVTPTSPSCFQTRRSPVLWFGWWKSIDVQSEKTNLADGWCRFQKWLEVRISRASNTAECESRKASCLTLSKGGRTARVTTSSSGCCDPQGRKA